VKRKNKGADVGIKERKKATRAVRCKEGGSATLRFWNKRKRQKKKMM
jgi:hypothetical protein